MDASAAGRGAVSGRACGGTAHGYLLVEGSSGNSFVAVALGCLLEYSILGVFHGVLE